MFEKLGRLARDALYTLNLLVYALNMTLIPGTRFNPTCHKKASTPYADVGPDATQPTITAARVLDFKQIDHDIM